MGSLRQSSFGAELHRNFSTGQRQSIHSSYSSSRQEITDDFKFLLKYSSDFHAKLRGEDVSRKETNSEVAKRLIHFPVITKSLETSDPPPVKETKCLKRMHSWNDHEGWEIRRTSNIERPCKRGKKYCISFCTGNKTLIYTNQTTNEGGLRRVLPSIPIRKCNKTLLDLLPIK